MTRTLATLALLLSACAVESDPGMDLSGSGDGTEVESGASGSDGAEEWFNGGNHDECPSDVSLLPSPAGFVELAEEAIVGDDFCELVRDVYLDDPDAGQAESYAGCLEVEINRMVHVETDLCGISDALCIVTVAGYGGETYGQESYLEKTGAPEVAERRALARDVTDCVVAGDYPACDFPRVDALYQWSLGIDCNETLCDRTERIGAGPTPLCGA